MVQAWVFEACQDLIRVFSRPLNLPHAYRLCTCPAASPFSVIFMSICCTSSSCSSLNHLLHWSQLEQRLYVQRLVFWNDGSLIGKLPSLGFKLHQEAERFVQSCVDRLSRNLQAGSFELKPRLMLRVTKMNCR